jgi:hypothetical protein
MQMLSDVIAYALLAAIFVVTGLRTLIAKPNKIAEIPLWAKKTNRSRNH